VKEDHRSSPCNLLKDGLPAISRQSINIPNASIIGLA